jgi:hypothetical protein
VKLSWRRSKDIPTSPGRGLTGPERAAALGVAAPDDDDSLGDAPAAAAPATAGPVMLTLTTRSHLEETEREAAAARPVRRRLERGAMGGRVSPTGDQGSGGACGAGGCG